MESYIHFTHINNNKLESIFKYGILNKKELKNLNIYNNNSHSSNYNGNYYISLTKKSKVNSPKSIYNIFSSLESYVGIEVNKPNHIYKTESKNPKIFTNTIIPIRRSPYIDEWQTNDIILPSDFRALIYNFEFFYKHKTNKNQVVLNLLLLQELLKTNNLDIPIIDKTTEKIL